MSNTPKRLRCYCLLGVMVLSSCRVGGENAQKKAPSPRELETLAMAGQTLNAEFRQRFDFQQRDDGGVIEIVDLDWVVRIPTGQQEVRGLHHEHLLVQIGGRLLRIAVRPFERYLSREMKYDARLDVAMETLVRAETDKSLEQSKGEVVRQLVDAGLFVDSAESKEIQLSNGALAVAWTMASVKADDGERLQILVARVHRRDVVLATVVPAAEEQAQALGLLQNIAGRISASERPRAEVEEEFSLPEPGKGRIRGVSQDGALWIRGLNAEQGLGLTSAFYGESWMAIQNSARVTSESRAFPLILRLSTDSVLRCARWIMQSGVRTNLILSVNDGASSHSITAKDYGEKRIRYYDPWGTRGSFLQAGNNAAGVAATLSAGEADWQITEAEFASVVESVMLRVKDIVAYGGALASIGDTDSMRALHELVEAIDENFVGQRRLLNGTLSMVREPNMKTLATAGLELARSLPVDERRYFDSTFIVETALVGSASGVADRIDEAIRVLEDAAASGEKRAERARRRLIGGLLIRAKDRLVSKHEDKAAEDCARVLQLTRDREPTRETIDDRIRARLVLLESAEGKDFRLDEQRKVDECVRDATMPTLASPETRARVASFLTSRAARLAQQDFAAAWANGLLACGLWAQLVDVEWRRQYLAHYAEALVFTASLGRRHDPHSDRGAYCDAAVRTTGELATITKRYQLYHAFALLESAWSLRETGRLQLAAERLLNLQKVEDDLKATEPDDNITQITEMRRGLQLELGELLNPSLLGSKIDDAQRLDFFTWFHLEEIEKQTAADGSVSRHFRSKGDFRELVLVKVKTNLEQRITGLELLINRAFIDGENEMFARDCVRSFVWSALTTEDRMQLSSLVDEIDHRLNTSRTAYMSPARAQRKLPDEPSDGYEVFAGKRQRYSQRLGRAELVFLNEERDAERILWISIDAK